MIRIQLVVAGALLLGCSGGGRDRGPVWIDRKAEAMDAELRIALETRKTVEKRAG